MAGVEGDNISPHMWVVFTYAPIEVEPQADGSLHTYVREGHEELAREDAALGCYHCTTPLTPESYTTPCPGVKQGS